MSLITNRSAVAACAVGVALLSACGDGALLTAPGRHMAMTIPAEAPEADPSQAYEWASALQRDVPLAADLSVATTVDENGGVLEIPEAGIRVMVPPGAVSGPIQLTMTALAGPMVAYEFGPHGLHFAKPLRAQQELRGTGWYKVDDLAELEVGYFAQRRDLNPETSEARIAEFLPRELDVRGAKVHFAIEHFSGYMVSSGRKGRDVPEGDDRTRRTREDPGSP
jgi:hypothetical protein